MNLRLALFLAWRSLYHHRTVALATVLGVAIGMTVVGAILIVDRSSVETGLRRGSTPDLPTFSTTASDLPANRILRVSIEREHATSDASQPSESGFPVQQGKVRSDLLEKPPPRVAGKRTTKRCVWQCGWPRSWLFP